MNSSICHSLPSASPYEFPQVQKAADLPKMCYEIVRIASSELYITNKDIVVALSSFENAKICQLFTSCINEIKNVRFFDSFQLFGFENECHDRFYYKYGIMLPQNFSSGIPEESDYQEVFKSITTFWKKAEVEDSLEIIKEIDPLITYRVDKKKLILERKEFMLFFNRKGLYNLKNQHQLIQYIAAKFLMSNNVICYTCYKQDTEKYHHNYTYLWIRKSCLKKAVEIFGFELPD